MVACSGLRRAGHLVWEEEGVLLCWGGVMEHRYRKPKGPNRMPSCGNSFHSPGEVATYCPSSGAWGSLRVGGEVPPPLVGAVGVPLGGGLLVWGGLQLGESGQYYTYSTSRSLYCVEVGERRCSLLKPRGEAPPASEKGVGWAWRGAVYLFSGYTGDGGPEAQSRARGFHWQEEGGGGGWHNALTSYCQGAWGWPQTRGKPPSARAGAAAAVLGDSVYIFGGRGRRGRLDDLYSLHLPSLTWTCLQACSWPDPWAAPSALQPAPRALHTLTTVPGSRTLALYGGIGQLHNPLQDLWLLHPETELAEGVQSCAQWQGVQGEVQWQEVELPYDHGEVRCWHGAVLVAGELLVHSGLTQEYYLTR